MSTRATIQVCHDRYRVVGPGGSTVSEGAFDSEEAFAELLCVALEPHGRTRWNLEVGRPWAQVRRIRDLPPVKDRHLSGLVRSDGARYFRARPGEVHVEAHRDSAGVVVALAVDDWLPAAVSSAARRAGGGLVGATVVGAADAHHGVTPPIVRHDRRRLGLRTLTAWMPVAVVPWMIAGAVYAADLHHDARTLEQGRQELTVAEQELREIEAKLGEAGAVVESVQRTGRGSAWALPLVATLARDLPVTASLVSLSAERGGSCAFEMAGDTVGLGGALAGLDDVEFDGSRLTATGCR